MAAAKKTIVTTRTLHVKNEEKSTPVVFDGMGNNTTGGKTVIDEYLPGVPVTLDAEEADQIMARYGGHEVKPGSAPVDPKSIDLPVASAPKVQSDSK